MHGIYFSDFPGFPWFPELVGTLAQWCLNVPERFGIMTDTQAIDVVTFDFKGTRVRCFVSGSTNYQMNVS